MTTTRSQPLTVPDARTIDTYWRAVPVTAPGAATSEPTRVLGEMLRDVMALNEAQQNFRIFGPDETESKRLGAVLEVTGKDWQEAIIDVDQNLTADGRVVEMLSEHTASAGFRAPARDHAWTREHGEDLPEVQNWVWPGTARS